MMAKIEQYDRAIQEIVYGILAEFTCIADKLVDYDRKVTSFKARRHASFRNILGSCHAASAE
jgi:hypothetical protein